MSLFNNVRSFFLLSIRKGEYPLKALFVKDISQDHKSSGKFSSRLSSDHEWRTLI